jgi:hypothetical protein
MELDANFTDEFIDQILELSADAHVRRRATIKNSVEFHNLTGAIAAYGTILALFTTLQRVQQFYEKAAEQPLLDCPQWVS